MSAAFAVEPPPDDDLTYRPLTGTRLCSVLMRDERFVEVFRLEEFVPYSAHRVLREVCNAIAASPERGVFRPTGLTAGRVELAISLRIGVAGCEPRVRSDLDALVKAGVVLNCGDGALRLPLDLDALRRPKRRTDLFDVFRAQWKHPGGRPRAGETAEQAEDRLKAEGFVRWLSDRNRGAETSSKTSEVSREVSDTENVVHLGKPAGKPSEVFSQGLVHVAVAVDSLESESLQQQQQAISRREPQTPAEVSGQTEPETSREPGGGFGTEKPSPFAVEVSAAAKELAGYAVKQLGWAGNNVSAAPSFIQAYLDGGFSANQVRSAVDAFKGKRTNGARVLFFELEKVAPCPDPGAARGERGHPGGGDAVRSAADPWVADVAADPEWSQLGPHLQAGIAAILRIMEEEIGSNQTSALDFRRKNNSQAFRRVAARFPDLWDMAGADPEEAPAAG